MILISGSNGFVGSKLSNRFKSMGVSHVGTVRTRQVGLENSICVGNIDANTDWSLALEGVNCVVHCAARAHKVDNSSLEAKREFFSINLDGTKRLVEQAIDNKVNKFIYISSVKVMGNQSASDKAFSESSLPSPTDYYGSSKLAAEKVVEDMCQAANVDYYILRPCLIYGDGAKANLDMLKSAIEKLPCFPTFCESNKRSLTNVEDLVDVICMISSSKTYVKSGVYFIADNNAYSTKEMCQRIKNSQDSFCYLFDSFNPVLEIIFSIPGIRSYRDKLLGNLYVDVSKSTQEFGLQFNKKFR